MTDKTKDKYELAVKTEEFVLQNHNKTEQLIAQTNEVLSMIRNVEFEEANISKFDKDIASANKLKESIAEFRKGYKNDYLTIIQEDLDRLMQFEKDIKTEVDAQMINKKEWKEEQHLLRYQNLTTAFNSLMYDYPELKELGLKLDYVLPDDWRLAKYKTINPIIENITDNLNGLNYELKVCVAHPVLYAKCGFNLIEYSKVVNMVGGETTPKPATQATGGNDQETVTIELHKNYLSTLDEMNIKYTIKE